MASRERQERKADARERRYEETSRMLHKNQEQYNVADEVFDRPTLEGVYRLTHRGAIGQIKGNISAGKEAHVYWATDPEGREIAVKIYYTSTAEFRKGMMRYIEGDPRFKRIRTDTKGLIYTWTQKEFNNLQLAESAGVNAPRPLAFLRNILVMTFIGEDGDRAPLLKEEAPDDPGDFYDALLDEMQRLYQKAGLVHGDLSEYNVMVWEKKPVVFDFSQAMLTIHPLAAELLVHDIETVNQHFQKLGVEVYDPKAIEEWVKSGKEDVR